MRILSNSWFHSSCSKGWYMWNSSAEVQNNQPKFHLASHWLLGTTECTGKHLDDACRSHKEAHAPYEHQFHLNSPLCTKENWKDNLRNQHTPLDGREICKKEWKRGEERSYSSRKMPLQSLQFSCENCSLSYFSSTLCFTKRTHLHLAVTNQSN